MSKPYNPLTLCRNALRIDDAELDALEEEARAQAEYISPLRMATQARLNNLGAHNLKVIGKLRELIAALRAGEELARQNEQICAGCDGTGGPNASCAGCGGTGRKR